MSSAQGKATTTRPTVDRLDFLFHQFVILSRYRDAALDKVLKPLGLNVSRHRAISVIASFETCTMSELSEFSCVDRTTMTRTVDQLVAADLVERHTPPTDRRQVLLNLTTQGRKVYAAALKVITEANRSIVVGLTDDALRGFMRAERAMIGNLVGDEAAADRVVNMKRPEKGG
jgi:DNA-binding MarR family transcriptional regulator